MATVNGAAAEGEYVMPDGQTYVFEGGTLTEIKPAEEDETEALKQRITELETELETANASTTEAKEALATAKEQFEAQTEEFKTALDEVKALIKSDTKSPKAKEKKEEPKTEGNLRVGHKRKNVE